MGKKRNNAAKKKQATKKKKQKLSSAYGVSVLKGGTIAQNNGVLPANAIADGSNTKKQTNGASSQNNASDNNSMSTSSTSGANTGRRSLGSTNNEQDEFHRMHASLEERSLALQKQKDDHRRSKKTRQKQQKKKGWGGKFATPGAGGPNFAPATLTLAPKTTQQLVDDAADHIAMGMNEIGQRSSMISTDAMGGATLAQTAIPGKSSLSAAAGVNWQTRVSNVSNSAQQEEAQQQNNPFAAFDEDSDSDSDNEWGKKKSKPLPKFQFQPASFSFQPAFANPPAAVVAAPGADIDPDL